jgi:hypothetical protein
MSIEDFGTSVPQRQYESDREEGIQRPSESSTLDLIRSKLEDPNFDAYELMRLVSYVMAMLVKRMLRLGFTVEELYIRHCLYECIKPLRALGRSIIDTDKLRKRADVIFWDGEAIKYVSATMVGWFVEALTQAKLTEFERDIVMRNYRELAAANEPQLRRETER